jgi:hypothetical protein
MGVDEKSVVKFDFQDGFNNDTIILKINGNEAFKKQGVTTDLRLSLAESFNTEILNGEVKLDLIIPTRNLSISQTFSINSEKFFAISIINHNNTENPKVEFKELKEPPFYL